MKKHNLLIPVCLFIFLSFSNALAAPLPVFEPVNISGIVDDFKRVPEKKHKGIPGISGSAGHDRTIPGHFIVTLTDYDGVSVETARTMTGYLDWNALQSEEQKAKPSFVLIRVDLKDEKYLKKGSRIKISGYTVKGDEGGTWTSYRSIETQGIRQSP